MLTMTEMVSTFPEGLKEALRVFGATETKTTHELHDFLVATRESFDLPPWHPFTLYMKIAARDVGFMGHPFSPTNIWFMLSKGREDNLYEVQEYPIPHDWIYVTLKLVTEEESTVEIGFVVQPCKNRIWSLQSETFVASGIYINARIDAMRRYNVRKDVIFEHATAALNEGKTHLVLRINVPDKKPKTKPAEKPVTDKRADYENIHNAAYRFVNECVVSTGNKKDILFIEDMYQTFIASSYYYGVEYKIRIHKELNKAISEFHRVPKRRDMKGPDGKAKYGYVGLQLVHPSMQEKKQEQKTDVEEMFKSAAKNFVPVSPVEVAQLSIMLDMVRQKAVDLGMEETFHKWETTIHKLEELYGE